MHTTRICPFLEECKTKYSKRNLCQITLAKTIRWYRTENIYVRPVLLEYDVLAFLLALNTKQNKKVFMHDWRSF
jgi:hypothetical protein